MRRVRSALRARLTPGRLLLAALLVGGLLALAALLEGNEPGAPDDHAAALVPGQAVAYVHANVDRDSSQWDRAQSLLERFPALVQLQNRLLRTLTRRGGALDLEREVRPWVADEAALALVPDSRGNARSLILLEVSDRELARAFLARAVGRERTSVYRGVTVRSYGTLATAFLRGFLAIGPPQVLRSGIDAALRPSRSLALDPIFIRARSNIPDRDRVLFGYASRRGLRGVLERRPGLAGRLARLADDPQLRGVAAALRAEKDGGRVFMSSALEPADADPSYVPRLVKVVSGDALAFVDMRSAADVLQSVSSFAGRSLPFDLGLRDLRTEIADAGGLRVLRELQPLLDGEAALFVSRSAATPVITLVVDGVDDRDADTLLARIQPLISRLVRRESATGQVQTFRPQRIAGLDAASLRVNAALEITYAIFDGRLVVSTGPGGIRRIKLANTRLADNDLFAPGMRDDLDRVTSVLFLDLEQLLALGEQAGLGGAAGYQGFKSDVSPVRAVSAITHVKAASKTAEIFIEVP
jgi:uncharacterized protein DUF3352